MPHSIPTVAPGSDTSGLSNSRHTSSSSAQPPASEITTPSPPGRWNPLRWLRAQTRNSTPPAVSSTAASTNVNTPNALRLSVTKACSPRGRNDFEYHGSTSEKASAPAAMPALRSSGGSSRSLSSAPAIAPQASGPDG